MPTSLRARAKQEHEEKKSTKSEYSLFHESLVPKNPCHIVYLEWPLHLVVLPQTGLYKILADFNLAEHNLTHFT